MIKVLFDLKKEYYFTSLYPVYKELSKDPNYDICFHVGKDHKRFLGIFLIKQKSEIEDRLRAQGLKLTDQTAGFDLVICGDVLKKPERYGDVVRVHLDHGVGTKTLRIRNIKKQEHYHYHVFLEGDFQDPDYKARRDNLLVISGDCTDAKDVCFCTILEEGLVDQGFL